MTDAELVGQLSQLDTLALTIYGEARGERVEGRVAVACVVRNRIKAKRYGVDAKAVCLMPRQFSCWLYHDEAHKHNYGSLLFAARALRQDMPGPALRECVWIAGGVLDDAIEDITRQATHYISRNLWESHPPKWALGRTPVIGIGAHVFFTEVDK
jgi:N-acetylmuramoyl-L-alanine amidase